MSQPPRVEIPEHLQQLLRTASPDALSRARELLASAPRRCAYVTSTRVADHPLRRGTLARLFGRGVAAPVLPRIASKLGGLPYCEENDLSWEHCSFLGQIDFSELVGGPPELPRRGILALDYVAPTVLQTPFRFRVRWYPEPALEKARGVAPPSFGAWEAKLSFTPGWSLPDRDTWTSFIPPAAGEAALEAWSELEGFREDERHEWHRLGGYLPVAWDEVTPALPEDVEHALVWRITHDRQADFGWGSNWVYVVVARDDLREGRLDRARVVSANG